MHLNCHVLLCNSKIFQNLIMTKKGGAFRNIGWKQRMHSLYSATSLALSSELRKAWKKHVEQYDRRAREADFVRRRFTPLVRMLPVRRHLGTMRACARMATITWHAKKARVFYVRLPPLFMSILWFGIINVGVYLLYSHLFAFVYNATTQIIPVYFVVLISCEK